LIGLRTSGKNVETGQTNDAEDGQICDATVSLASEQALQIAGCTFDDGICGSEAWTQVRRRFAAAPPQGRSKGAAYRLCPTHFLDCEAFADAIQLKLKPGRMFCLTISLAGK
jgi:hypothetical protein